MEAAGGGKAAEAAAGGSGQRRGRSWRSWRREKTENHCTGAEPTTLQGHRACREYHTGNTMMGFLFRSHFDDGMSSMFKRFRFLKRLKLKPETSGGEKTQQNTVQEEMLLLGSPPGAAAPPAGGGQALYGSVVPQNMANVHKENTSAATSLDAVILWLW